MRVLILGGGGTLGAFSAGALRAIAAAGWAPDAVIGSSAGGINLLRWLAAGPDEPARFWTSLRWTQLIDEALGHNFVRDGLLDAELFRARVEHELDWEAVYRDPRALAFIVVDLGTGRVAVRGNRTEPDADALRAVAMASFALPPLLPPVRVGDALLADGGLLQNAPLEAAIQMGATEIVYLCNVQVLPHAGFARGGALRAATRYADIFFRRASNVGFADAHITGGRYRGVPFLTVAPPSSVRLDKVIHWMLPTPGSMEHLVREGEIRAREALAAAADARSRLAARGEGATPQFATTPVGT